MPGPMKRVRFGSFDGGAMAVRRTDWPLAMGMGMQGLEAVLAVLLVAGRREPEEELLGEREGERDDGCGGPEEGGEAIVAIV